MWNLCSDHCNQTFQSWQSFTVSVWIQRQAVWNIQQLECLLLSVVHHASDTPAVCVLVVQAAIKFNRHKQQVLFYAHTCTELVRFWTTSKNITCCNLQTGPKPVWRFYPNHHDFLFLPSFLLSSVQFHRHFPLRQGWHTHTRTHTRPLTYMHLHKHVQCNLSVTYICLCPPWIIQSRIPPLKQLCANPFINMADCVC